jgi:DNA-binding response OmpR family regulator
MSPSPIAVVVDADSDELHKTERALEEAGFVVVALDSFAEAKAVLVAISPEIIIADIRLKAFNGLHLAALCAVTRPGVPFITTHTVIDPVLEADAKQLGASYVLKTESRSELKDAVKRLVGSRRSDLPDGGVRRWPRKVVATPPVATVAASEAQVLDVSYGGVCLKLPTPSGPRQEQKPPEDFEIVFPALKLALKVSRVWMAPDSGQEGWLCGVDVSQNRGDALDRWRSYVDSVN